MVLVPAAYVTTDLLQNENLVVNTAKRLGQDLKNDDPKLSSLASYFRELPLPTQGKFEVMEGVIDPQRRSGDQATTPSAKQVKNELPDKARHIVTELWEKAEIRQMIRRKFRELWNLGMKSKSKGEIPSEEDEKGLSAEIGKLSQRVTRILENSIRNRDKMQDRRN